MYVHMVSMPEYLSGPEYTGRLEMTLIDLSFLSFSVSSFLFISLSLSQNFLFPSFFATSFCSQVLFGGTVRWNMSTNKKAETITSNISATGLSLSSYIWTFALFYLFFLDDQRGMQVESIPKFPIVLNYLVRRFAKPPIPRSHTSSRKSKESELPTLRHGVCGAYPQR